jgi:protein-S-isoprenylcysteine O-methyltransferase Ste14
MYRSDVRGAVILVALLWITVLFVLFETWSIIPDSTIRIVVLLAAAAVLLFNTAAIAAMIQHYREDKQFIYGLDIKNADAARNVKS